MFEMKQWKLVNMFCVMVCEMLNTYASNVPFEGE